MTVTTDVQSIVYDTDGSTADFTIPFYFLRNTDVYADLIDASGVAAPLVPGTDFSLEGAGQPSGGSLTTFDVIAAGYTLHIYRDVPATQETQYQQNDAFPAKTTEKALDKLTMLVQRAFALITTGIRFPYSEIGKNAILPRAAARAHKTIVFKSDGSVDVSVENYREPSDIVTETESYAKSLFDQATALSYSLFYSVREYCEKLVAGVVGGYGAFLQSGVGAVERTFQDKQREVFSVIDFGADPFGVKDSTAAFNLAIAAAIALGSVTGYMIYIPPGRYRITSTLTISASTIRVVGAGVDAVTIEFSGANQDCFLISGTAFDASIENLRIIGTVSTSTSGAAVHTTNGVGQTRIKNIRVESMYNAVRATNGPVSGDLYLDHVGAGNILSDAFYIDGISTLYMSSVTTFRAGGAGIRLVSAGGFYLLNCVQDICTHGLLINPGTGQEVFDGLVTNFEADDCTADGIVLDSSGGGAIFGVAFNNLRAGFCSGNGITIDGGATTNISMLNPIVERNLKHGIALVNGSAVKIAYGHILGNSAIETGYVGINVTGGTGIYLHGNTSTDRYKGEASNQEYGLYIAGSFTGVLRASKNDFSNNVSGTISNNAAPGASVMFDDNEGGDTPNLMSFGPQVDVWSTIKNGVATQTDVAFQIALLRGGWRDNVFSIQNTTVSPANTAGNAAITAKNAAGHEKMAAGFGYTYAAGLVQGIIPPDTAYIEVSNNVPADADTSFELRSTRAGSYSYAFLRYEGTNHNLILGAPNGSGGGQTALGISGSNGYVGILSTTPQFPLDVNGIARAQSYIRAPVKVSALPSSPRDGQMVFVSDSTVAASGNFGAPLVGGGTYHVPGYYDGGTATWRIG
ncbi:right-handed parallel beta-helix repeat-containing protein [Burkholderia cenocepacia]|uniref:right-handed parallel beta-helix repeat-containing protein n=1 Tax=Burkholderia cenocepacia TaxID=95486 RepID=UPI00196B59A3|nr:right-handed parallel beta-helix repeat-containing protein [Burkholderia cenocepacia]MBN3500926.1 hypothetical protein [Burkholderia cenocepacia]